MHVDTESFIPHNPSPNPEPQTLENISEIPQENIIPEHVIETHVPQPISILHLPIFEQCDASTKFNLEHKIPLSPISFETLYVDSPTTPSADQTPPRCQPLSMDGIVIPSDQVLPLLENLTKHFTDIESSPEQPSRYPNSTLRKIQIKPLIRKKPSRELNLPYKEPYKFFKKNSEPIFELLTSVIHISLKNFKSMEEDALIFTYDIDAE
jgi:hypothetical protein